jgi:hypothetical protein
MTTFNIADFLKNNLKSGYDNGSFTYEQVNIYSFNYLSRGQITQADFDEIQLHLNPIEIEEEIGEEIEEEIEL